jgi:hypothetical protein
LHEFCAVTRKKIFEVRVMSSRQIQHIGRFWVATVQRADGQWLAWAQTTPIYADAPLAESRECVWIASGFTREQAIAKLKQELALPPYDAASVRERHRCWQTMLAGAGLMLVGLIVAEPTLVLAGTLGISHGFCACVMLAERTDGRRA